MRKPWTFTFIGWLPILKILPKPPPSGTSQVSADRFACQFAVMMGALTAYHPSPKL
jgi:hypothetical protein